MAFLSLKDVGKIYVSDGNVSVGIRGVNLSFELGEFVAVTGKSGSGKSTLLNVISGMDSYEEGELYIEGQSTSHYLQPEWEEYREKYISFIFQDYNIIESFTVLQNVELALLHIADKKERRARAKELICRVGLGSHMHHKGSKLSGGQKQRTVIARALAKDSPIILA
ncbi:MAG: ATP-binding cassette domain-containing protein, partial [Clostridia bacterium]|nr:ATP-binding cassette domain-containing protein [Clostridia bacterium]